jgi:lysophospholipase L1-like esterase
VAIGDSIPYNMSTDCPGCTGFIDTYAKKVEAATGRKVEVSNRSEHTGLTLDGLMSELGALTEDLRKADVIVVAIAHNSSELASDEPCGAPLGDNDLPTWSKVTRECAVSAARKYRPMFAELFADVAALREGSPTILRTVNRYNDFIGWDEGGLTPAEDRRTKVVLDAWNDMVCETAVDAGFGCADIYQAFNGPRGLRASGGLLAEDYTHPSQRGNDVIAQVLEDLGFAPLT